MEKILQQILLEIRNIKQDIQEFKLENRQDTNEFKLEIRSQMGKLRDQMNNRFDFLHQELEIHRFRTELRAFGEKGKEAETI